MSCPACGKDIPSLAWVCPYCKAEVRKPSDPPPPPKPEVIPPRGKLIREVSIFLIGFGLLVAGLGGWLLSAATTDRQHSIALSLLGTGVPMIACGILLPITRQTIVAWIGAGFAVTLFVALLIILGVMDATSGHSDPNGCSVGLPALFAFLVIHRVNLLSKSKDEVLPPRKRKPLKPAEDE